MEILSKLFGSTAKVKIMRLFLLNAEQPFDVATVAERANVQSVVARKEVTTLEKANFLKRKSYMKDPVSVRGKRKRVQGWVLNEKFPYLNEVHSLVVNSQPLGDREITQKFSRVGKVKFLVVSGVFLQEPDSRVDLLVVGDNLKQKTLENTVRILESEVGKELRYSAFNTEQFKYRMGMYDRLIRDILDYPHQIVIDRLGIRELRASRV